jgi:hypothetical protein
VRGMPWPAAAGRADPTRRVWYHACELAQSESTGVSHGDRGAPGGGPPVRAVVHRTVKNEAVLVEWQNIANPPVVKVLDEQKSEPAVPRPWREGIPATLPSPILSGMSRLAGPWRRWDHRQCRGRGWAADRESWAALQDGARVRRGLVFPLPYSTALSISISREI